MVEHFVHTEGVVGSNPISPTISRVFGMSVRSSLVSLDPDVMGGTPVFAGTRVPVATLFDYLEHNDTLDVFLDDFPTIERERAIAFLESAKEAMLATCA